MKQTLAFSLVLVVAAAGTATAQLFLSGEATPNPATPGSQVSLTIEASTFVTLVFNCPVSVDQGAPGGPDVQGPIGCTLQIQFVGPGAPYTMGWSVSPSATPGDYFIRVLANDNATGAPVGGWFPVRVVAPGSVLPILSKTTGPVMNGSPVGLSITSPGTPNATYILAASLTTNVGLALTANQHLALDDDVLFNFSLPVPNPLLFTGFQGNLDGSGGATATMLVPASPLIVGWPLAFQGAVINSFLPPVAPDNFALTTPLSCTIH